MTRYFGGKGTGIGKEIAASIVRLAGEKKTTFDSYLEPFVGMGGVMRHVVEPLKEHFPDMKFCGKDLNPGIIDFYQHICKGGNFLIANHFTQEDIDKLHKTRDKKTAMHILLVLHAVIMAPVGCPPLSTTTGEFHAAMLPLTFVVAIDIDICH